MEEAYNGIVSNRGPIVNETTGQRSTYELPKRVFYPEVSILLALSTTREGSIWVQRRCAESCRRARAPRGAGALVREGLEQTPRVRVSSK